MKKIIAIVLALTLALSMMTACSSGTEETTTPVAEATSAPAAEETTQEEETQQEEEEPLTIAGIVFKDEFTMKMVQQGYEDAAADYGVEIVIGNSMGDLANEQQLVYSYMDMGVDGIAITPYSEEASVPILKEAYDKLGLKCEMILYDADDHAFWNTKPVDPLRLRSWNDALNFFDKILKQ